MAAATDTSAKRAPVAGLLLAAGGGQRLGGRPKALLECGDGRLLVERAMREMREGGCATVHVVLGAGAAEVRERLGRLPPGVALVDNPRWAEGMGSSLRAGLASLTSVTDATAALVMLVDQPRIGARAVARLLAARREGAQLVAAAYGGERGHPVLFGREHWEGVARAADGDQGARAYLRQRADAVVLVECADIAAPDDIDTPEDLALLE
ncbi:NTP transferase domain-containing protein [Streptomyces sp. NPDC053079]|uniref:nucleotidyltransferase family protein n=1 Tax=Streptomyces sp. NPDC053079 TaxID=3365697 RepID=UPI0037D6D3EB